MWYPLPVVFVVPELSGMAEPARFPLEVLALDSELLALDSVTALEWESSVVLWLSAVSGGLC